jgi:5-methylcytosine-specific restriction protein A
MTTFPTRSLKGNRTNSENGKILEVARLREHKRIERNQRLAKAAKKLHGYSCQACGFKFSTFYGKINQGFIEAHHLTPLAELKGKGMKLDPRTDFAVLCSNCHSTIHRFESPEDVDAFRASLSSRAH